MMADDTIEGAMRSIQVGARVSWARYILEQRDLCMVTTDEVKALRRLIYDLYRNDRQRRELQDAAARMAAASEAGNMPDFWKWTGRLKMLGLQSEQREGSEQ
jgi:hypothetical protein